MGRQKEINIMKTRINDQQINSAPEIDFAEIEAAASVMGINGVEFNPEAADENNETRKTEDGNTQNADTGEADANLEGDTDDAGDDENGTGNTEDGNDENAVEDPDAVEDENTEDSQEDSENEPTGKLTPELQKVIDKRIGKEVAKRKTLEKELAAAKSELESAKTELTTAQTGRPIVATGVNPLLLLQTEAQVVEREEYLEKALEWCEDNEDGYQGEDDKGNPVEYTSEQIRARRRQVQKELAREIPKVRELVQKRVQTDQVIKKIYPALTDAKSKEYQVMQGLLNAVPGLHSLPNAKMLIGDMLAGAALRAKDTKNVQPVKPAPKVPTHTPASASVVKTKTRKGGASVERMIAGGGDRKALEREADALLAELGF